MQRQKEPKSTSTLIDAQGSHQDLKKTYHLKWTTNFCLQWDRKKGKFLSRSLCLKQIIVAPRKRKRVLRHAWISFVGHADKRMIKLLILKKIHFVSFFYDWVPTWWRRWEQPLCQALTSKPRSLLSTCTGWWNWWLQSKWWWLLCWWPHQGGLGSIEVGPEKMAVHLSVPGDKKFTWDKKSTRGRLMYMSRRNWWTWAREHLNVHFG